MLGSNSNPEIKSLMFFSLSQSGTSRWFKKNEYRSSSSFTATSPLPTGWIKTRIQNIGVTASESYWDSGEQQSRDPGRKVQREKPKTQYMSFLKMLMISKSSSCEAKKLNRIFFFKRHSAYRTKTSSRKKDLITTHRSGLKVWITGYIHTGSKSQLHIDLP